MKVRKRENDENQAKDGQDFSAGHDGMNASEKKRKKDPLTIAIVAVLVF